MYIAFLDYLSAQVIIQVIPNELQKEDGDEIADKMADDLGLHLSDCNWMI